MPRTHRSLLSLFAATTLAALGALSACERPRSEEPATRFIPPAAPYLAPVARAAEPAPAPAPEPAPRPERADPAPSPEEVRAFERRVPK